LALYERRSVRTFLEPSAAAKSALADYIRKNPIKTLLAIAHVRKRTRGPVNLANTHPFVRELWGRHFTFAHNGTVRGARKLSAGRYTPIGTTDSEHAFCALMNRLDRRFPKGYPGADKLSEAVAKAGAEIGERGTFNFLLADGEQLFARCATKLCYIIRKAPFKKATLADDDIEVDFAAVTTPKDRVAVVATAPLTRDETWNIGVPGNMWVFRKGRLAETLPA
jgi:glutamine amidotransferase